MFRRHRSHGSEAEGGATASEQSLPATSPNPPKDRNLEQSGGSEFIFDGPDGQPISSNKQTSRLFPEASSVSSVRTLSPGRKASLGLHLVHQPPTTTTSGVDVVFIHGLGGDSQKSWSRDHHPELFWPGKWLPHEPELQRARIFTFGYNASFRPGEARSIASVTDFAKELLFELRFSKSDSGDSFGIGDSPLIFVVHSMGGLVAKKACLLGQNDAHYEALVRSVSAIVFLSTPHRGSNLPEVLNRILAASFQSTRHFITDLSRSSMALEEFNEQFRHLAPRVSIWSFYETLPTAIGLKKTMVLEKDSAMLGYSKEISRPLHADHHGVCKFSSLQDPNYISVRNAIASLLEEIKHKMELPAVEDLGELESLQQLFPSFSEHEDDLDKQQRLKIGGSCEWILQEDEMADWIKKFEGSHLVWFSAAPASGKSVLSAFIVTALQQKGLSPHFFFFNAGDQHKRSVADLLRSLAFQIARRYREVRRGLLSLVKQGLHFHKADAPILWHKVYENLIFKTDFRQPVYWIIDGLDECNSPKLLLDLMRSCPTSRSPLRIFIASRHTESIQTGIAKTTRSLPVTKLEKHSLKHNSKDIQFLVESEMGHMRGNEQIRKLVTEKILARAEGNFLWTRLVLEEIAFCQTVTAIDEILDEFPSDMQQLYHRMEQAILTLPRKSSRALAHTLLRWAVGARRPLSLRELSEALTPEFSEILDLKRTISDVCGQFVQIDATDSMTLIHHTAREYLVLPRESELCIDSHGNHEILCIKMISALLDSPMTSDMIDQGAAARTFLLYAATSWMYHLKASKSGSSQLLDALIQFFNGTAFPLWVHTLSLTGNLDVLTKTSKNLASFVALVRREESNRNPLLRRLSDVQLLDQWTTDLIRIVAKFSTSMLKHPRAIYSLLSPFSPEGSALRRQQHCQNENELSILGDLDGTWTDRLARVSIPEGFEAYKMACAGQWVAVLGARGRILLWDTQNFLEFQVMEHTEPVTSIAINMQGDRLATYGLQTTKVWNIPSGDVLKVVDNNLEARACTLYFVNNDTRLLAGFDDRNVRYIEVEHLETQWHFVHPTLFKEPLSAEAAANSPTCIAFNKIGSLAGVAYRGFPLSVWSIETGECVRRCNRGQETKFSADTHSAGWFVVWRFVWNPVTDHVIGFYSDGYVFKWHPLTAEYQESPAYANDIATSADGRLFLSSTSTGVIKIWDFVDFSVLFQLSSDDLLVALAFGPDCLHFYDLRCGMGNSINAWKPNSLLRLSETEEVASDLASETAVSVSVGHPSEARLEQAEAITALAASPDGSCFCIGNDDGSIELRDMKGTNAVEVGKFNNFMEVSHLTWSRDSRYLAAADLGGDIMISEIIMNGRDQIVKAMQVVSLKSPRLDLEEQVIQDLIFSPDSTLLLVIAGQSGHVWSLMTNSLQVSKALPDGSTRKWLSHLTRPQIVLGLGVADVRVVRWKDLAECAEPHSYAHGRRLLHDVSASTRGKEDIDLVNELLKNTDIQNNRTSTERIRGMLTQNSKYVFIKVSTNRLSASTSSHIILPWVELETLDDQSTPQIIQPIRIPETIQSQVRIPLGILPGQRYVFLDWNLWLSSYKIQDDVPEVVFPKSSFKPSEDQGQGNNYTPIQKHYFIPDDWATSGSLDLCYMTADGTLIYPRDNKVSLIKTKFNRPSFRHGSSAFGSASRHHSV